MAMAIAVAAVDGEPNDDESAVLEAFQSTFAIPESQLAELGQLVRKQLEV